jgi:hypothetical protein
MVGWRKTLCMGRSCLSSNGHGYRAANIRPQIEEEPELTGAADGSNEWEKMKRVERL